MAEPELDRYKLRVCGGRRYRTSTSYALHSSYHSVSTNPYLYPNDEEEHSRLAKMHVIFRSMWGSNLMVNLGPSTELILDIGTGAGSSLYFLVAEAVGTWALEVAKEFPATKVVGMDISAVHLKNIPPNLEFVVGDLATDLQYFRDGSIDLIHSRLPVHSLDIGVTDSNVEESPRESRKISGRITLTMYFVFSSPALDWPKSANWVKYMLRTTVCPAIPFTGRLYNPTLGPFTYSSFDEYLG